MDDLEINKAIAELAFGETMKIGEKDGQAIVYNSHGSRVFNFNNWNNLMPLVIDYCLKYQILNRGNHYLVRMVSRCNENVYVTRDESLARATVACLLEILKQSTKE